MGTSARQPAKGQRWSPSLPRAMSPVGATPHSPDVTLAFPPTRRPPWRQLPSYSILWMQDSPPADLRVRTRGRAPALAAVTQGSQKVFLKPSWQELYRHVC